MKKGFRRLLLVMGVALAILVSAPSVWSETFNATTQNGDSIVVLDSSGLNGSGWDGTKHVVVTLNSVDASGIAIVLDSSGVPSDKNPTGYKYIWADFFAQYTQLFGSNDGVNWTFIDTISSE